MTVVEADVWIDGDVEFATAEGAIVESVIVEISASVVASALERVIYDKPVIVAEAVV